MRATVRAPEEGAPVSINTCEVFRGLDAESLQPLDTMDHTHERTHCLEYGGGGRSYSVPQLLLLRPKDTSGVLAAGLMTHPSLVFTPPSSEDTDHPRVCIINVKNPICKITELPGYGDRQSFPFLPVFLFCFLFVFPQEQHERVA